MVVATESSLLAFDEADGEASQTGHVLRAVTGAQSAAVLVPVPVDDVVVGLDAQ